MLSTPSCRLLAAGLCLSAGLVAAESPSLHEAAMIVFKPLPERFDSPEAPLPGPRVDLGKLLFFERRLSKSHELSCASCHELGKFGVDGQRTSAAPRKAKTRRNAQTVFNSGNHVGFYWDGRASTLEEQAKLALTDPLELGGEAARLVKVLRAIPDYQGLFAKAFPDDKDPISLDNAARALAAFERTLVTPSRFDAYLKGKEAALTEQERHGLMTFMSLGCMVCHKGEGVGGGMYQSLGFAVSVPPEFLVDQGRFEITKKEDDRHRFRVPSLRNVEKTGPYLHDGSLATLDETVRFMAKYQLGKDMTAEEVGAVVAFLKTLTGELPQLKAPAAPVAGKDLPAPEPG